MVVAGRVVFVDGWFSHVGGAARGGFAALDAKTGKATPFRLAVGNPIVANGRLYGELSAWAAVDLPSLTRDKGWKPRVKPDWGILSADNRSVYFETATYGNHSKDQVIALDATTGAVRWRSPIFSRPVGPGLHVTVGSSPSYVLIGGNFQHVQG